MPTQSGKAWLQSPKEEERYMEEEEKGAGEQGESNVGNPLETGAGAVS
jgi:hypothetical protein